MDWLKDSKGSFLVVLSTSEHKNQWPISLTKISR
jgi:hypothetical protein